MKIYLVSACLMGLRTRYDGNTMSSAVCRKAVQGGICFPVCPEQLGGLPTPRPAADLVGGDGHDVLSGRARVITRAGMDVSDNFIQGAKEVLKIAGEQEIAKVFLKARSPSCGIAPLVGVTAALLQSEGFTLVEVE